MNKNWYTRIKPEHGTADWLAARWKNESGEPQITASVAAVVHGAHPFKTAADLATELLAPEPPQPETPNSAMERGNRLEPTLIKWAADRLNKVLYTPDVLYCYEEDGVRLMSTLDALSMDEASSSDLSNCSKVALPARTPTGKLRKTKHNTINVPVPVNSIGATLNAIT